MNDELFWLIGLIPITIPFITKYVFKWRISKKEFIAQIFLGFLSYALVYSIGRFSAANDLKTVNGEVLSKRVWKFACPTNTMNPCVNSYECNPRRVRYSCTIDGQPRMCSRIETDTCYRYPYEQNWLVKSSVHNQEIEIPRIDVQGVEEPEQFARVQIGESTANIKYFKNWVKASASSHYKPLKTVSPIEIPDYPQKIENFWKMDRVVLIDTQMNNTERWNEQLASTASYLSRTNKQNLNIIVVFVEGQDHTFMTDLKSKWKGFKINDNVIVFGLKEGIITWGESASWSDNPRYDLEIRNYITNTLVGYNITNVDPSKVFESFKDYASNYYVERSESDFEYLKGDTPVPTWLIIFSLVFNIGFGIFISKVAHETELLGDESE